MKFKSFQTIGCSVTLLAIIGLILFTAPPAQAQVTPLTLSGLTNFPATLAAGATSTVTNIVAVPRYGGMAVSVPFNAASGSGAVLLGGSFTVDGTNYGCNPFTVVGTANGTTQVMLSTNWSQSQLAGYSAVNFTTLTNAASNGVLTNKAPLVNRVFYNY